MKIFKILICAAFVLVISACHDKDNTIYKYPDEDPTTDEKGNIGDPCNNNIDCKKGLLCIDKVCSEPVTDDDSTGDSDENPDIDGDDSDTEPAADADSDTNVPDTTPTDDTDTAAPDEDEPEDTDTQPDEDIPEYFPECGNGIRDPGEECDNGLENSDEPGIPGITCRTDCVFARCQDGIVDEGEICDDGNASVGDYCSPDCQTRTGYCGDGIQQTNEICDPGLEPYCADDCSGIAGYCGDGIKQSHEVCDKAEPGEGGGEGIGPYYCNVNCKEIMGSCGDGEVQLNEKCDNGSNNGRYGYCNSTCSGKGPRCGDGNIDTGHEVCDDGNTLDGDYCSADCKTSFGSCGDGIKQSFEACDKANYGDGVGVYCSDDCRELYGRCGDGVINSEAGEECDEGANNNQTYCPYGSSAGCTLCSPACRYTDGIPRYCGDGVVSTISGEACDNATFGSGTGPYYCSDDCTQVTGSCGDGVKQPNEACDPGIDPYCSADCKKSEGSCGDGIMNGDEECDNGSANGQTDCEYGLTSCQLCTTSCTLTNGTPHYCGNRTIDSGETCDDGSDNGTYGHCNSSCDGLYKHCGDGNIDSENGEVCDNGDDNGQIKCPYGEEICKVCTSDCKQIIDGNASYCGDGKIQRESCLDYGANCVVTEGVNEECDDGELNGTYGHCLAGCYGAGQHCGDGEINGSEVCDDGDDNGKYGKCKTDCSGLGERCGDGEINGSEVCDDGANNGKYTQDSPGYCNSGCDGYGEGGFCGDNAQNGTEACDEGNNNGKIPCAYGETSCLVCSTRCRLVNGNTSYCGDGNRDPDHEACDEGSNNGDYNKPCNSECSGVPPRCGDGNIDDTFGENCDDGELNGTYNFSEPGYCNSDCGGQGEGGYCGDGKINGNEICDAGTLNGDYGGTCNTTCSGLPAYCGDGEINGSEVCDDGENLNGTYNHCNSDCSAVLECGDGITQGEFGETCDSGDLNGTTDKCPYNTISCELCNSSCQKFNGQTSYCGDETVDPEHEACDDGDFNGTYNHCKADCSGSMPKCGDGNIDGIYGETCDEGDGVNGTYGHCNDSCTGISECGDGIQQPEEKCDSGLFNGTYQNCNDSCTGITGRCGDGILQKAACGGAAGCEEIPEADEACDRGNANGQTDCNYGLTTCQVCTASCTLTDGMPHYCGDETIDPGEVCDDGADNGTFGKCDETCQETVTWRCGDGNIDFLHGEICDNGDGINGTYTMWGPGTCNSDCKGYGEGGYCGDGEINGDEVCDDGTHNNTEGYCNEICSAPTPVCGNGIVEEGESCDDGEDNNKYGACNSDCQGYGANGSCGDSKVQKQTAAECDTYIAEDPANRSLCDGNITENCCEVVEFATGVGSETCDDGSNNGTSNHCNKNCDDKLGGCGDNYLSKDEACEKVQTGMATYEIRFFTGDTDSMSCNTFPQFSSGTVTDCNSECMPVLTSCTPNDSYTSPFFDTNQTICYDNTAPLAVCPSDQAEDFYGQSPNFSYQTKNLTDDGETVSEAVSGLIWQKNVPAGYDGCSDGTECNLTEAQNYCNNLDLGGYDSGWRLPSAFEFPSIADFESTNHIDSLFTNPDGASFWTAEGLVFSTEYGTMSGGYSKAQVKCVRDDGIGSYAIFSDNMLTLQYTEILVTVFGSTTFVLWYFDNPMSEQSWEAALATCKETDINGVNRMRLPTVNELITLIDTKNGGSLIPGFNGTAWTSTTWNNDTTQAYVVDFSSLSLTTDSKTNSNYVICVE